MVRTGISWMTPSIPSLRERICPQPFTTEPFNTVGCDVTPVSSSTWTWRPVPRRDRQIKRKQFSAQQIIGTLKEAEAGAVVTELCRKRGRSSATYYAWKAKIRTSRYSINLPVATARSSATLSLTTMMSSPPFRVRCYRWKQAPELGLVERNLQARTHQTSLSAVRLAIVTEVTLRIFEHRPRQSRALLRSMTAKSAAIDATRMRGIQIAQIKSKPVARAAIIINFLSTDIPPSPLRKSSKRWLVRGHRRMDRYGLTDLADARFMQCATRTR